MRAEKKGGRDREEAEKDWRKGRDRVRERDKERKKERKNIYFPKHSADNIKCISINIRVLN
jgi:hypothetical protein